MTPSQSSRPVSAWTLPFDHTPSKFWFALMMHRSHSFARRECRVPSIDWTGPSQLRVAGYHYIWLKTTVHDVRIVLTWVYISSIYDVCMFVYDKISPRLLNVTYDILEAWLRCVGSRLEWVPQLLHISEVYLFLDTLILCIYFLIININNFRGDLSDISARTATQLNIYVHVWASETTSRRWWCPCYWCTVTVCCIKLLDAHQLDYIWCDSGPGCQILSGNLGATLNSWRPVVSAL